MLPHNVLKASVKIKGQQLNSLFPKIGSNLQLTVSRPPAGDVASEAGRQHLIISRKFCNSYILILSIMIAMSFLRQKIQLKKKSCTVRVIIAVFNVTIPLRVDNNPFNRKEQLTLFIRMNVILTRRHCIHGV